MESNYFLTSEKLEQLLAVLQDEGYDCYGPQLLDGVISYQPLQHVEQLPRGWGVEQEPASYRAFQQSHTRYFAWSNGPQALKPITFSPRELLWESQRSSSGALTFSTPQVEQKPVAILGVRACDVAALQLQDEHFLRGHEPDPAYQARRKGLFLINVNCSHPSTTCFCASTGDGPALNEGSDLILDELDEGFVASASSPRGMHILDTLDLPAASPQQLIEAARQRDEARACQSRALPEGDLHRQLAERWEHAHWQNVADRCMACGNCTSVCPTCFCHTEFDTGGLDTGNSEHVREWDSCFGEAHSYIHGTVVRSGIRQRYRQWLGHKFSNWFEQYGRSGCVGCGRCITWCPVGIEVTRELAVLCNGGGDE